MSHPIPPDTAQSWGDFLRLWALSSLGGILTSPSVWGPVFAAIAAGLMVLIRDEMNDRRQARRERVAERLRASEARVAELLDRERQRLTPPRGAAR